MHQPELLAKVKNAPMQPGCYIYRDSMGNVIYVGKAKLLRNRVRQYFQKRRDDDNPKLDKLVRVIADVEYHITPTERDALMHEYRLIKQYKPYFNSQLVSEPRQLFLRIDQPAPRPTLTIAEQTADDDADYFGYFSDSFDVQEAITLINAVWRTPVCCKQSFAVPGRPCVQYEVGRCTAPCGMSVNESTYRATIAEIIQMLRGERTPAFERLSAEMKRHSAQMNYEKAASVKLQLDQLERLRKRSRSVTRFPEEGDMLVFLRAYREAGFSLFLVRDGKVTGRRDFDSCYDEQAAQSMLNSTDREPLKDSAWLPGCLIELFADKLFVPLPIGASLAALCQLAKDSYERFNCRDAQ